VISTGTSVPAPGENDIIPFDKLTDNGFNPAQESETKNLVFIDSSLPDAASLLDDVKNKQSDNSIWEVVWIEPDSNGVSKITETLSGLTDINSIHILTHGDDTGFQLGTVKLDAGSFSQYDSDFSQWGHSLAAGADLLIYGCDLASSEDGRHLLSQIADTTGSDVAASIDTTGHESLGANWDLEFKSGDIETALALSDAAQENWIGSLPVTTITSGIELNTDGGNNAFLVANDGGALLGGLSSFTFETSFVHTDSNNPIVLANYATASEQNSFSVETLVSGDLNISINGTTTSFTNSDYFSLLSDNQQHTLSLSWDSLNGEVSVYIDGIFQESTTGIAIGETLSGGIGDGTFVLGQSVDTTSGAFVSVDCGTHLVLQLKSHLIISTSLTAAPCHLI